MPSMHTIWIKVQKRHISVYKDKELISSVGTQKYLGNPEDQTVIATKITDAVREAGETFDAED